MHGSGHFSCTRRQKLLKLHSELWRQMDYQLWPLTKPIFPKEKGIATILVHGGALAGPSAWGPCPALPPAQPSPAPRHGGTQAMAAGQELTRSASQHPWGWCISHSEGKTNPTELKSGLGPRTRGVCAFHVSAGWPCAGFPSEMHQ